MLFGKKSHFKQLEIRLKLFLQSLELCGMYTIGQSEANPDSDLPIKVIQM